MGAKRYAIAVLGMVLMCATPEPARAQAEGGATRMFFAPTGRTLPRGEGYIGVYAMAVPFFQAGVTDSVTVGAGVPLLPYLMGEDAGDYRPFVVTAKARVFHRPRTSVAAGAIHFSSGEGSQGGFAYVVGTRTRAASSASVGAGCLYSKTGSGLGCQVVVSASADHRLNKRVTLITENHLLIGETAMLSGGVRLTRHRFSSDFGMVMILGSVLQPGLMVNVAYRLGGR